MLVLNLRNQVLKKKKKWSLRWVLISTSQKTTVIEHLCSQNTISMRCLPLMKKFLIIGKFWMMNSHFSTSYVHLTFIGRSCLIQWSNSMTGQQILLFNQEGLDGELFDTHLLLRMEKGCLIDKENWSKVLASITTKSSNGDLNQTHSFFTEMVLSKTRHSVGLTLMVKSMKLRLVKEESFHRLSAF